MKLSLTLDLNKNTQESSRKLVYEKLNELGWAQIQTLTTLFEKEVSSTTEADAKNIAKTDVATACRAGNVTNYDAAVSASVTGMDVWSQPAKSLFNELINQFLNTP